jgi:hypothetical protein
MDTRSTKILRLFEVISKQFNKILITFFVSSKIVKYDYINVMEIGFYLRKNALVDYYFPMQLK